MYSFYKSFGTILGFLIMTLVVSGFGAKVTQYFLFLTFLSMVLLNSDKFNKMLQSSFKQEVKNGQ